MVEYRVLSSALMKDKNSLKKVWRGIEKAISAFNNRRDFISQSYIEKAINGSDVEFSKTLISHYKLV